MSAALSAIVVGQSAQMLRPLFRHLDAQTAKDDLEVVVVAPGAAHQEIAAALPAGIAGHTFVARDPLEPVGAARAAGIRAASTSLIVLTETHCFPEPEWARALIRAHREPCVAVAPCLGNANPGRALSWVNFFLDYGPFAARPGETERSETSYLPGHNSSFKRDAVMAQGERLERLLEDEPNLHEALRSTGAPFLREPAARINHVNVTRWRAWLPDRWHTGRLNAVARAAEWSLTRRLFYAAAWPLIAALRTARTVREMRRCGHGELVWRCLPALVLALTAQSAGEAAGFAFGEGGSRPHLSYLELYRLDNLARGDPIAS